jgi:hypothetical protein
VHGAIIVVPGQLGHVWQGAVSVIVGIGVAHEHGCVRVVIST